MYIYIYTYDLVYIKNYNNIDQHFNRHDFLITFSLIIWYINFVMTS